MSFSRAVTPYWNIWVTPFGRAVKWSLCTDAPVPRRAGARERPFAVLRLSATAPALLYLLHPCSRGQGPAIAGETCLAPNNFTTR